MKEPKPKGRPRKAQPKHGERVGLSLRVTPEIKTKLDAAARDSGRSQSQEAELRLERSFYIESLLQEAFSFAYGPEGAMLLRIFGEIVRVSRSQLAGGNWIRDPRQFELFRGAIKELLEALAPAPDSKSAADGGSKFDPFPEPTSDLWVRKAIEPLGKGRIEEALGTDFLMRLSAITRCDEE